MEVERQKREEEKKNKFGRVENEFFNG